VLKRRSLLQRDRHRKSWQAFWDSQGVILIDFLEAGATVNSDTYIANSAEAEASRQEEETREIRPFHTAALT
jgi:hypothetical protein